MQRVTAAALLTRGIIRVKNPSFCEDALSTLQAAITLGAGIVESGDHLDIRGGLNPKGETEIQCNESGLCLRMLLPIAALSPFPVTLKARKTLTRRPVGAVSPVLRQLGAECRVSADHPPVRVTGPLRGGNATVNGSLGSQFLSGLLLALPLAPRDSTLTVLDLKSTPYIDLTLDTLKDFGIQVNRKEYHLFTVAGKQAYRPGTVSIEGDWSGAAFLIVAAALTGNLRIHGLKADSAQADRRICQVLTGCGGKLEWDDHVLHVKKSRLRGFTFDATDCPDLFPPLAVLAAACSGTSRIFGVHRLECKESDRARALVEELSALGARITRKGDCLEIQGGPVRGGTSNSRGDHRMVMAAAVAGLVSTQPVEIVGASCVAKSYPRFFEDLKSLGGKIDE